MEGIEFEEDKNEKWLPRSVVAEKESIITRLLERAGVKNRATANITLLSISIVCFIAMFILLARLHGGSASAMTLTPQELKVQMQTLQRLNAINPR